MNTDDFDPYDDDDDDDGFQEVRDRANDLKNEIDKKKNNDLPNEAKNTNTQLRNQEALRNSSNGGVSGATSNQAGKEIGKEAGKKAGKEATKKAGEAAAKKGAEEAGKAAALEGAKAAGSKAAVAAGTAASSTGYGAIIVAAITLANAIRKAQKKMRKKLDEKAEDNGFNLKGIRRLFKLSPLLLIFAIVFIIIFIVVLLMHVNTVDKTTALKEAIQCAENNGCTDFKGTKISISSAKAPVTNLLSIIEENSNAQVEETNKDVANRIKIINDLGNIEIKEETSKKLIYFTDIQIARLVIEFIIFENAYYGFTDTINNLMEDLIEDPLNGSEHKDVIENLFKLLVHYTIIGDIYEAYSLFNWLRLEKIAFNKINWKIVYTGGTGTGNALADDIVNKICNDKDFSENAEDLCNSNKETEALTFKVIGDINIFSSTLWVPTSIWDLGGAITNAVDVFGLRKKLSFLQKWKSESIPDEETLVNAVSAYLPSWVELFAAYVNSNSLKVANEIYNYYVQNLGEGGEFETNVTLYALRNYEITNTTNYGDIETYYEIYKNENGTEKAVEYVDKSGKKQTKLSEDQMQNLVNSKTSFKMNTVEVNCTDSDYKNKLHGCIRGTWTYTDENTGIIENCTDKDFGKIAECQRGVNTYTTSKPTTVYDALDSIGGDFSLKLTTAWGNVKSDLISGWYKSFNVIKEYIQAAFPLTFASTREWRISVTKGTTFDKKAEREFEVNFNDSTETIVQNASEGFKGTNSVTVSGKKLNNTSKKKDNGAIVSETVVFDEDNVKIKQITEFVNMEKEVITHSETLSMTSSKISDYIIKKDSVIEGEKVDVKYDNRLAYAVEKLSLEGDFKINSDDLASAYEAIRTVKGEAYALYGIVVDYSNLPDGLFGWPLEEISNPSLSDCTGERANVFGKGGTENHGGDDYPAPHDTKILAAKAGKVIINNYNDGGYGYYVALDHGNGWYTLYGHMNRQSTLSIGEEVAAGQVIGFVGTTGYSTGNHLHFEIRYGEGNGIWSAEKLEPILYISKETMPEFNYIEPRCVDLIEFIKTM